MMPFPMFRGLFRDDRLISRTYLRLFSVSAALCVALTLFYFRPVDPLETVLWLRILITVIGMAATVGLFFIWLGMWFYWARLDGSEAWRKTLWFLVLLVGFCLGSTLYFLFVYLPQAMRRAKPEAL
jgi:hypothetical protein